LTLSHIQTKNDQPIDTLQDAETTKWVPWPEAHTNKGVADNGTSRGRLPSEVEAGDCWRSAALSSGCFIREEMERAGVA